MRALQNLMGVVVLLASVAGCGTDIASKTVCSQDSDCMKSSGNLFEADASVDFLPKCCTEAGGMKVCVLPVVGCDSGYRYLTSQPGYGDCVPAPMCPMAPADMTMPPPVDMSGTD
jgi:hypothetical protein